MTFRKWLSKQDDSVLKLMTWSVLGPLFVIWLVGIVRVANTNTTLAIALLFLPGACLLITAYAGYRAEKKREGRDNG